MGRTKNPLYLFKDALKDASKRKGEMGSSIFSSVTAIKSSTRGRRKHRKTRKRGGCNSRRNRQ